MGYDKLFQGLTKKTNGAHVRAPHFLLRLEVGSGGGLLYAERSHAIPGVVVRPCAGVKGFLLLLLLRVGFDCGQDEDVGVQTSRNILS